MYIRYLPGKVDEYIKNRGYIGSMCRNNIGGVLSGAAARTGKESNIKENNLKYYKKTGGK